MSTQVVKKEVAQRDYQDYLERLTSYPHRDPLTFEEFVFACQRWEKEYGPAWKQDPPDFKTIDDLEFLLAV